jgi:cytochrome P450
VRKLGCVRRANIKLAVSGGQNEPCDAISGTVWALLTHPEQLALACGGKAKWLDVFEEYARWIAPIGMSPRRVAKHWSFGGVDFEPVRIGGWAFRGLLHLPVTWEA